MNTTSVPEQQKQLTNADAEQLLLQGVISETARDRIINHNSDSTIAVLWMPNPGGRYVNVSMYERPISVPIHSGRVILRYDVKLRLVLPCCKGYKPCQHSSTAKALLFINNHTCQDKNTDGDNKEVESM